MAKNSDHYYLSKGGVTTGPYTMPQLKTMWQNGSITADCLCWTEGFDEWADVSSLLDPERSDSPHPPAKSIAPQVRDSKSQIPQSIPSSSCTPAQLLRLVSHRDYMIQSYAITAILALLVNFVVLNQRELSATFQLSVFTIATISGIVNCYYVFSVMRTMNTGKLGAWLCVIVVFLFPLLVGLVTVHSINSMAWKELASKVVPMLT